MAKRNFKFSPGNPDFRALSENISRVYLQHNCLCCPFKSECNKYTLSVKRDLCSDLFQSSTFFVARYGK